MSGIEGIGDAVTGGMLARAVEPGAGEASHGHSGACLNCGSQLVGEYCHACGQAAHVHRSLSAFFHDLLHGVFHFEGKIWHTLPMLAFKPGELTRRYIAGERARFVSPMALFLFSVFLMFAVFSWVGSPFGSHSSAVGEQAEAVEGITKGRDKAREDLKEAEAELAAARAAGEDVEAEQEQVTEAKTDLAVQEQVLKATAAIGTRETKDGKTEVAAGGTTNRNFNVNTGWPALDHAIKKANDNSSLLLYKLQSNAYKFSWALIPISVPFVWLMLFWKRRYKVYDHTVFVTYSIAFMSLGVIFLSLLRPLGVGAVVPALAIAFVPPFHMYKQLKGAYGLSRFSALWRTFFLLLFAGIASTLFFVMLLALGAFG